MALRMEAQAREELKRVVGAAGSQKIAASGTRAWTAC